MRLAFKIVLHQVIVYPPMYAEQVNVRLAFKIVLDQVIVYPPMSLPRTINNL